MKPLRFLLVMTLIVGTGCAGGGGARQRVGRAPPPPKEAPAVPPRKDVPVDRSLLASARQEVLSAASSNDPALRESVMVMCRGLKDPAAREVILKGLQDETAVVRFQAALAAGDHRLAEARPLLEPMAAAEDLHLRVAVVYALHRLGVTDYTRELERTAIHPEPGVRADTAMVLGLLGEKSAIRNDRSILRVLARDSEPLVRQRAWEAIWRLGDTSTVDELVGLSMSRFADDQVLAVQALAGPRNSSVREVIRNCLTAEHAETSLVAARAMGQLGSDDGYGVALKGAKSGEGRQRFLAALAFGAIGRTDAQPTLKKLMADRDPRIKLAAAAGLLEIASAGGANLAGG
jgi:HEAT repeat protein